MLTPKIMLHFRYSLVQVWAMYSKNSVHQSRYWCKTRTL